LRKIKGQEWKVRDGMAVVVIVVWTICCGPYKMPTQLKENTRQMNTSFSSIYTGFL
jgi:hypothetical protein